MSGIFPCKRPLSALSTTLNDDVYVPGAAATASKRIKQQKPLPVPPGHVSFRFLCHESRVSAFIGKGGSAIKHLTIDTSSKIQIEDSLAGSDDRVIVIVAGDTPCRNLTVRNRTSASRGGGVEEYLVSAAQDALVRVFERVVNVAAAEGGVAVEELGGGTVSCRLLAEVSEAGSVIGKGGKVIESIRKEIGCKIRVLLGDKLPVGVKEGDEVIEIEGDIFSLKRALIAVSSVIQKHQSARAESNTTNSKPSQCSYGANVNDPTPDAFWSYAVVSSNVTTRPLMPLAYEVEEDHSPDLKLAGKQEIEFNLLCSADRVGGVIGKRGSILKAIQEETGAVVSIGPAVAGCNEQLVTVTSRESPESRFSPAQRAVLLVFARYVEANIEKKMEAGSSKVSQVMARLLVPEHQVGCLLGKRGAVISELRNATQTKINIFRGNQLPKFATEKDEVVQISGEFVNVQDALHQITGRLRDNLFSSNMNPVAVPRTYYSSYTTAPVRGRTTSSMYDMTFPEMDGNQRSFSSVLEMSNIPDVAGNRRSSSSTYETNVSDISRTRTASRSFYNTRFPEVSTNRRTSSSLYEMSLHNRINDPSSDDFYQPVLSSQSLNRYPSCSHFNDSPGIPHEVGHSPSSELWTSQISVPRLSRRSIHEVDRGLTSVSGSLRFGNALRPHIVTTTTVEIIVPDDVIGSLYNENGSNLARLEQISGAKITIHDPCRGARDGTVVISGSHEETQAAQSLLHAFILTGIV